MTAIILGRRILLTIVLAFWVFTLTSALACADDLPPVWTPVITAGVRNVDQAPPPPPTDAGGSMSAPGVLDPMDIYNNLLIPDTPDAPDKPGKQGNLPPQSEAAKIAAKDSVWAGGFITSTVPSDLTTSDACVDFNDKQKWASQIVVNGVRQGTSWKDHYAGWGFFAVDNPRYYRAQPVAFSFDANVNNFRNNNEDNGISAKITSNQPYAAGFGSPLIPVRPGDEIRVIARYLMSNQPPEHAYDWVSLGIKPDDNPIDPNAIPEKTNAVYANGFVRGRWAALEQTTIAQGNHVMVMLQGQSPAAINSNIWFDDVEIFVNGNPLPDCEFAESFSGK